MKCPNSISTDDFNKLIPVCLKEITVENDVIITTRSCAAESRQFVVCPIVPNSGHCSTCENDLCNSADGKKNSLIASFVLVVVTLCFNLI